MKIKPINVRSLMGKRLLNIIMRTFIFLMCTTVFCLNTENSYSQENIIIEKNQLVTVDHVFKIIKKQTELNFVYPKGLFKNAPKIQLQKGEIKASKLIDKVLEKSNLNFKLTENNTIIINKSEKLEVIIQTSDVSGVINDNTGQTLPGVNIIVEGTSIGTQSDFDGKYSIKAKKGDVLLFSFIGFQSQKVTISDTNTINLVMEEELSTLDEIVIVGYGTQKKIHLTSSVAVVDTKDIENRPVRSLSQMLSASVPNLNITTTSGAPNAESSINIRGFTGFTTGGGAQTGAPLILVDGFPQDIKNVNPDDVEAISVLKDAAASAIYGSRAPNGVILITTKSGKKGGKMKVNWSSNVQISQPIGLPGQLNSLDYIDMIDARSLNTRGTLAINPDQRDRITQFFNGEITNQNTINPANNKYIIVSGYNANNNSIDAAFRDQVVNFRHNMDLSGGSDKTSYYASYSFFDQEGVYESDVDFLKRNTISLRVNTDVTDFLTVGVNMRYTNDKSERPRIWTTNQNNGQVQNLNGDGQLLNTLVIAPYFPIFDDNGSPNQFSSVPSLDGRGGTFQNSDDDIWAKIDFALKPVKGLTITGDYAHNYRNRFSDITSFTFQTVDNDGTLVDSRRNPTQNSVQKIASNTNYHIANLRAQYTTILNDSHEFLIMAGYTEEENRFESISASNSEFYTTSIPSLSGTFGDNTIVSDNIEAWGIQGFFGRFSYNYKGKYLIEANGRYDASSRFAPDERWAFFPAFSAGWNAHLENFWPFKETINRFKITGNWGQQGDFGTFGGNNYPYIATLGTNGQTPVAINGERPAFVTQPGLLPTSLTWARPRTVGFGLDIGLFDNRLSAEYQWYQKTIFDQIGPALTLPETLGTAAPITNSTVSETRGWELSLLWRDKLGKMYGSDVNYSVRAGLSDYIGYVVDYVDPNLTGTRVNNSYVPGQRFGQLFGLPTQGIAQNFNDTRNAVFASDGAFTNNNAFGPWNMSGMLLFEDANGDGQINSGQGNLWYAEGDREQLGWTYPRYTYNIALQTDWKGLSLSVLLNGVGSQKRYVANKFTVGTRNHVSPYQLNDLGYWTPDNTDAWFPRADFANVNQDILRNANDRYVHNLAHLRIQNINLNYQFPSKLVQKLKLSNASVNFSVENAGFIYNKMWNKEVDPIMILAGATTYPPQTTFSWGVKLGI